MADYAAPSGDDAVPVVPPANDGPVPVMLVNELPLARSGAIDTDLRDTARTTAARPPGTDWAGLTALNRGYQSP